MLKLWRRTFSHRRRLPLCAPRCLQSARRLSISPPKICRHTARRSPRRPYRRYRTIFGRIDTRTIPSTLLEFGFMVRVMAIYIPCSSRRYTAVCHIRYGVQPYHDMCEALPRYVPPPLVKIAFLSPAVFVNEYGEGGGCQIKWVLGIRESQQLFNAHDSPPLFSLTGTQRPRDLQSPALQIPRCVSASSTPSSPTSSSLPSSLSRTKVQRCGTEVALRSLHALRASSRY